MNNRTGKNNWIFGLLLIPFISAIQALNHFGFLFKSGVAGGGILILLYLYGKQLKQSKDVWAIIGAFLFSIGGDWFLSNRNGEMLMFIGGIAPVLYRSCRLSDICADEWSVKQDLHGTYFGRLSGFLFPDNISRN